MTRNFYNLPGPWDPGYAPYDPAEAEGLERRAINTDWMPRGTYDDPAVSAAGYATPAYALSEGYGQGALVTKWIPRGTVDAQPKWLEKPTSAWRETTGAGGRVDYAVAVATSGLGDDAVRSYGPNPYQVYGQRAAHLIMQRLSGVTSNKSKALRTVLDQIDPALWPKAQRAAATLPKGTPANTRVEAALASAMADGITSEVVQIGKTGRRPKPQSLLGLSSYGPHVAMGAILSELGASTPQGVVAQQASVAFTSTLPVPAGQDPCKYELVPAVGQPGQAGYKPAYVRRVRASGREYPAPAGCAVSTGSPASSPITQFVEVGPFRAPIDGGTFMDSRGEMSQGWKDTFADTIKKVQYYGQQFSNAMFQTGQTRPAKEVGLDRWFGLDPNLRISPNLVNGKAPTFKTKHPTKNEMWGIYLITTPTKFGYQFKKIPENRSWWGALWDWIKDVASAVYHAAADVVEFAGDVVAGLAELACSAVSNPNAGAAAAAAGGPAGAAGAAAAAGICAGPVPAAIPPVVDTGPSSTTLLLLAGAAVGGYLLLKKKRA